MPVARVHAQAAPIDTDSTTSSEDELRSSQSKMQRMPSLMSMRIQKPRSTVSVVQEDNGPPQRPGKPGTGLKRPPPPAGSSKDTGKPGAKKAPLTGTHKAPRSEEDEDDEQYGADLFS